MLFLSANEIKDAEMQAMREISCLSLVKRAAEALCEELEEFGSVRIYCGKGNNGSDGYAAAVLLHNKGKDVEIVKVYEPHSEECAALYEEAKKAGIAITDVLDFPTRKFEAVLDAVFGIGVHGELDERGKRAVQIINAQGGYVVSADIPSGMDADSGKSEGECVRADKTVTFTAPKKGMLSNESVDNCGETVIREVGIAIDYSSYQSNRCVPITNALVKAMLPRRSRLSHKGTFGNAVIIAGSKTMAGAAALAAEAAYKSGCGLVKVIAPESICAILNIMVREAIIIPVPEHNGIMLPDLNEKAIAAVKTASAVLIGCGLGRYDHSRLIQNVLTVADCGVIIDADGINALSGKMEIVQNKNVLLTPHPLEFSRVSGAAVAECEKSRIRYADAFSKKWGVALLLKGARTSVSYGGSNTYVSLTATSALSTAGSGDVLGGIAVSLAAQGLSLTDSGAAACHIHALAGMYCEKNTGAFSTTAEDILNAIKYAFKEILK